MKKSVLAVLLLCISSALFGRYKISELADLANDAYNDTTDGNLPLGFKREKFISGEKGFQAVLYGNEDTLVIAYRGTDFDGDLLADLEIGVSLLLLSPFQEIMDRKYFQPFLQKHIDQAKEVYEAFGAGDNRHIIITGHSLGGFLAQIAGYIYGEETHTFNAPGALAYTKNTDGDDSKITNHISIDIISMWGRHTGKTEWNFNCGHDMENFSEYLREKDNKDDAAEINTIKPPLWLAGTGWYAGIYTPLQTYSTLKFDDNDMYQSLVFLGYDFFDGNSFGYLLAQGDIIEFKQKSTAKYYEINVKTNDFSYKCVFDKPDPESQTLHAAFFYKTIKIYEITYLLWI